MRFLSVIALPFVAAMPSRSELRPRSALSSGVAVEWRAKRNVNAALAQFKFSPYELTHMAVGCTKDGGEESSATGPYNCTLSFDWFDPNSVRQNNVTSTACSSSWAWDGTTGERGENNNYNTNYQPCEQDGFLMKIVSFPNGTDFRIGLAHRYKDSENFSAPYDHPQTFAQPDVHITQMTDILEVTRAVRFAAAGIIYANITGVSD